MTCKCGACEMESKKTAESRQTHECDLHMILLELADEAWMEVLKEKIKAHIVASNGDHLDKVAQLVSEANTGKWTHMVTGKIKCEEYKNALKELMSTACKQ